MGRAGRRAGRAVRRVGAQAGTGTRVALLRPTGTGWPLCTSGNPWDHPRACRVSGLAPARLRRPGPGGVCHVVRRQPGAVVLACCTGRATRPGWPGS